MCGDLFKCPPAPSKAAIYIEFGDREVAKVDVDFFSIPGRPTGTYTTPSPQTAEEKAEFASSRHARWFGLVPG